jgi:hypothetical protein
MEKIWESSHEYTNWHWALPNFNANYKFFNQSILQMRLKKMHPPSRFALPPPHFVLWRTSRRTRITARQAQREHDAANAPFCKTGAKYEPAESRDAPHPVPLVSEFPSNLVWK